MAKGKTKRASGRKTLNNLTKNLEKTQYKGVQFTFDDEMLQEAYIQAIKKYEVLEINWYEPVTYNMATSIAYYKGNMRQELEKLLERYQKGDNNYSKGSLHKNKIFDKVRKDYAHLTPLQQVRKLNSFFELVEEQTKKWNEEHDKNNGQQKYNIVYYDTGDKGSNKGTTSPV